MVINEFYIQPTIIPTYLFSYNNEYVTCYNDGLTVYKFGFKINLNNKTIQITQWANITKSYICFLI